jgi:hypothetical protein
MPRLLIAAVLIFVCWLAIPPQTTAADPSIELASLDEKVAPSVSISVPTDADTAQTTVLIRQTGSTRLRVAEAFVVMDGASVAVAVSGAAVDGSFILPPADRFLGVTLTAAGATPGKVGFGRFYAVVAGVSLYVADIFVRKVVVTDVTLVGATNSALAFTSAGSDFHHSLVLTTTNESVSNVSVNLMPFRGPDSTETTLGLVLGGVPYKLGDAVQMAKAKPLAFELAGTLNRIGAYNGLVVVDAPGTGESVWSIAITITTDPVSVAFDPADDVRGTLEAPGHAFVLNGHETAGRAFTLGPPEVKASLKEDNGKFQIAGVSLQSPAPSQAVTPWGPATINGTLTGLSQPGQYVVVVTFAQPTGAPVQASFNLFLREPWWRAALFIALGLLAGFLFRVLLGGGLKTLATRAHLQDLAARALRLRNAADPVDQPVVDAVRDGLLPIAGNWRKLASLDDAAVAALDQKLNVLEWWLRNSKAVRTLGLTLANQPSMKATEAYLGDANRISATEAAEESKRMLELESSLRLQRDMLADIDRLRSVVAQRRTLKLPAESDNLLEIEGKLTQARSAVNGNDLKTAGDRLEEARSLWLRLLLDGLKVDLSVRPEGFPEAAWAKLTHDVELRIASATAAPTARDGLAEYEEMARDVVAALAKELRSRVAAEATRLRSNPLAAERVNVLDRIVGECDAIAAAAPARYEELHARYEQAIADYRAAPPPPAVSRGASLDAGLTAEGMAAAVGAPTPAGVMDLPDIPAAISTFVAQSAGLTRAVRIALWVFTYAAVAIVGIAFGVLAIWSDDLSWGGLQDYATAVLWGVGVHVASGSSSNGISGLMSTLKTGGGSAA